MSLDVLPIHYNIKELVNHILLLLDRPSSTKYARYWSWPKNFGYEQILTLFNNRILAKNVIKIVPIWYFEMWMKFYDINCQQKWMQQVRSQVNMGSAIAKVSRWFSECNFEFISRCFYIKLFKCEKIFKVIDYNS